MPRLRNKLIGAILPLEYRSPSDDRVVQADYPPPLSPPIDIDGPSVRVTLFVLAVPMGFILGTVFTLLCLFLARVKDSSGGLLPALLFLGIGTWFFARAWKAGEYEESRSIFFFQGLWIGLTVFCLAAAGILTLIFFKGGYSAAATDLGWLARFR